jgi:Spy/CpxP family protein refolding chaperone
MKARSVARLATVITIATLALAASVALAQGPGQGPPPGGPGFGGPGFGPPPGGPPGFGPPPGMRGPAYDRIESLGLSDAQHAKLDSIRDEEMRKVIRLDADARIAEMDLERLFDADRADAQAVEGQAARVASLRGEILRAHVAARLAIHDLLTPDQRARLARMRAADRREPGAPRAPERDRSPAK